ncbi:MAG: hypothetical protein ACE37H_02610 [Phycisphaeraceae bacterium]
MGGCTTGYVVNSWRGHSIHEVVEQWGPPGTSRSVDAVGGFKNLPTQYWSDMHESTETPVTAGRRTYTWESIDRTFHPQYTETVGKWHGDTYRERSYVVPERWETRTRWFELTTDEAGNVVSGRSRDSDYWFVFGLFAASDGGWGRPRE